MSKIVLLLLAFTAAFASANVQVKSCVDKSATLTGVVQCLDAFFVRKGKYFTVDTWAAIQPTQAERDALQGVAFPFSAQVACTF